MEKQIKKGMALLLAVALLAGCSARSTRVEKAEPQPAGQQTLEPEDTEEPENPSSPESGQVFVDPIGGQEQAPALIQEENEGESPIEPQPQSSPSEQKGETSPAQPSEDWMLILANYDHPIGDYEPELEEVQNGYRMDVRVAGIARQMIADANAQGVDLLVCSAYRPYSSQERNFNNSVNNYISWGYSRDAAITETKKLIAEPGKSEHQTGLAADIVTPAYQMLDDGYAETAAAKWLKANASSYGFILRYPKDKFEATQISFEPWHYRYVGVEAAKAVTEAGLSLEEYLGTV